MLPLIQNRAAVVGVLVASVVAILGHAIPYKLGLLLAVLIGMASAMWYEEHFDVVVPDLKKEGESHE
jgi:predicted outer membrane lipoprotein